MAKCRIYGLVEFPLLTPDHSIPTLRAVARDKITAKKVLKLTRATTGKELEIRELIATDYCLTITFPERFTTFTIARGFRQKTEVVEAGELFKQIFPNVAITVARFNETAVFLQCQDKPQNKGGNNG
ncbi:hypothetical protein B0187_04790 [Haemophilus paracuniculus]|uniref:Uncharacterized protein n=1 Tax=Haemophilus paracuniculus TaxID=734 RepID=A0A1T0ATM6_9PAST|nr:hypothetical protein [Haemophilus paracuniculus]OOR99412.1 hypothetical protein B0187_04790 [Haemophilus paracuniculus]